MSGRIELSRARTWLNSGPPRSGTSAGTGRDDVEPGDLLIDTGAKVTYVNEGTKASPYWTPAGYDQAGLFGVHTDFRDGVGKAIADAANTETVPGSGLRIFGQGMEENDSGLVVQASGEGGSLGRMIATNQDLHTIAIGMDAGVMQPDQHGQLVVDIELTHVSAITLRSIFLGFIGLAADALNPPVSGATTTATLVLDDLAGILMDVGLTDSAGLFGVHNKSNAAASLDLTTGSLDTGVDVPAFGTFQRLRAEIFSDGDLTVFADKVEIFTQAIALDVDEECSPVFVLESTSSATKSVDVRRFSTWANR